MDTWTPPGWCFMPHKRETNFASADGRLGRMTLNHSHGNGFWWFLVDKP